MAPNPNRNNPVEHTDAPQVVPSEATQSTNPQTGEVEGTHSASKIQHVSETLGLDAVIKQEAQAQNKTRIARYEVGEPLGKGGFGVVYRGYDPNTNRHVAIKVARQRQRASAEDTDGILEEARAAGQLDHPGLVKVFDADESEDGTTFIVMELVDGGSLRSRLKASQSVTLSEACYIIAQVADAVHHAHKRGFVHRDLKPENILLSERDGSVKVADFGLALHDDVQRRGKVASGGTVSYMAPEQIRGETDRLDGRTDVWALGVILYEMLTGQRPFRGDPESTLKEILEREPKPPRQINDAIPPDVERLVLDCLQKSSSARPTTAMDVKRRLASAKKSDSQKPMWERRLLVGASLVAIFIAAVAVWMTLRQEKDSLPEGTPPRKLETIVWRKFNDEDTYDPDLRTDQFWVKCHNQSLFALSEGAEYRDGLVLKASITLEDTLGCAGMFWAYRPDLSSSEPGHWRCLVAHVGRQRADDPFYLRLESLQIVGSNTREGRQLACVPIQPPPSPEVTIEIHVTPSRISQIRVGDEIPIRHFNLIDDRPSRSWPEATMGRCGIFVAGAHAAFRQVSRFPLDKESSDGPTP